jgi:hypothetical protein
MSRFLLADFARPFLKPDKTLYWSSAFSTLAIILCLNILLTERMPAKNHARAKKLLHPTP